MGILNEFFPVGYTGIYNESCWIKKYFEGGYAECLCMKERGRNSCERYLISVK